MNKQLTTFSPYLYYSMYAKIFVNKSCKTKFNLADQRIFVSEMPPIELWSVSCCVLDLHTHLIALLCDVHLLVVSFYGCDGAQKYNFRLCFCHNWCPFPKLASLHRNTTDDWISGVENMLRLKTIRQ